MNNKFDDTILITDKGETSPLVCAVSLDVYDKLRAYLLHYVDNCKDCKGRGKIERNKYKSFLGVCKGCPHSNNGLNDKNDEDECYREHQECPRETIICPTCAMARKGLACEVKIP